MAVLGIDVSHHNGSVEWGAVSRSEIRFAFIKASEGVSMVDPLFADNWRGCGETGLLRGAYHFGRPGSDPEVQAAHFAAVVGPGSWDELPPVLDLETAGGLPASAVIDWTLAFLARAGKLMGRPLIMYTGGLWRRTLGDPLVPQMQKHLLWTARYGNDEPRVPRSWQRWDFWQFTDGQSGQALPVPGVRGPCDANRFRGSLEELRGLIQPPIESPPGGSGPLPVDTARWPGRFFVWPHVPPIRGEDVRAWQVALRNQGYSISVDGFYGPESRRACLAMQRHAGLEPDGIVGPDTWNASLQLSGGG